jgi:hypothetical protein
MDFPALFRTSMLGTGLRHMLHRTGQDDAKLDEGDDDAK